MDKITQIKNKLGWFIGGGVLAAITSSLCCIGPLVLTVLGVSGAAVLTKFEVFRIPMILVVVLFFCIGGISLYKKRTVCERGSICADSIKFKQMILAYWIGLAVAFLGVTSPYWVIWIFA